MAIGDVANVGEQSEEEEKQEEEKQEEEEVQPQQSPLKTDKCATTS